METISAAKANENFMSKNSDRIEAEKLRNDKMFKDTLEEIGIESFKRGYILPIGLNKNVLDRFRDLGYKVERFDSDMDYIIWNVDEYNKEFKYPPIELEFEKTDNKKR